MGIYERMNSDWKLDSQKSLGKFIKTLSMWLLFSAKISTKLFLEKIDELISSLKLLYDQKSIYEPKQLCL